MTTSSSPRPQPWPSSPIRSSAPARTSGRNGGSGTQRNRAGLMALGKQRLQGTLLAAGLGAAEFAADQVGQAVKVPEVALRQVLLDEFLQILIPGLLDRHLMARDDSISVRADDRRRQSQAALQDQVGGLRPDPADPEQLLAQLMRRQGFQSVLLTAEAV